VLLIAVICAGVAVLVFTAGMVRLGVKALGSPGDRAAGNQVLQQTAVLLGGRFRDRRDYPWYRRPAQYGAIEGELGDLGYELYLMPWNAEDCGGAAMVRIHSRQGRLLAGGRSYLLLFSPERVWHWPDLADPGTLAGYVRQAIAIVDSGGMPPDGS
jgi:hypothetical protein